MLRQELKNSKALKKTTVFCATCSPCSKQNPSLEMGWLQGSTGCCLNTVPRWEISLSCKEVCWLKAVNTAPMLLAWKNKTQVLSSKEAIPCPCRCLQCSCHFSLQTCTVLATQLIALWKVNLSQAFFSLWLIANLIIVWLLPQQQLSLRCIAGGD